MNQRRKIHIKFQQGGKEYADFSKAKTSFQDSFPGHKPEKNTNSFVNKRSNDQSSPDAPTNFAFRLDNKENRQSGTSKQNLLATSMSSHQAIMKLRSLERFQNVKEDGSKTASPRQSSFGNLNQERTDLTVNSNDNDILIQKQTFDIYCTGRNGAGKVDYKTTQNLLNKMRSNNGSQQE